MGSIQRLAGLRQWYNLVLADLGQKGFIADFQFLCRFPSIPVGLTQGLSNHALFGHRGGLLANFLQVQIGLIFL